MEKYAVYHRAGSVLGPRRSAIIIYWPPGRRKGSVTDSVRPTPASVVVAPE